jgi:hypothetical protein
MEADSVPKPVVTVRLLDESEDLIPTVEIASREKWRQQCRSLYETAATQETTVSEVAESIAWPALQSLPKNFSGPERVDFSVDG